MRNIICMLLFILCGACAYAQDGTIRVKKKKEPSSIMACDPQLICDTVLLNKEVLLSRFSFKDVPRKDADELRELLRFVMGKRLMMNKDSLRDASSGICDTQKYTLIAMEVSEDNIGRPEGAPKRVWITYHFAMKPKEPYFRRGRSKEK